MAGFTLTEVILVMLILGILVAIGTPTFKYVTTSNRISNEINGLLGDMQFARSVAVKQGLTVTVCSSSNSTTTSPTCNTGGATGIWQTGWIVFLDTNGDGQVQNGEQVIRIQPAFTSTDTLVSSVGFGTAKFNRMGYAPTTFPTNLIISLNSSPAITSWTRCLNVTPIGYATTEQYGAGTPSCQ
jgi:type IV fimbrial biogenesis protein FimT